MYKDIVIVSARTPFGRYGGSLREFDYFDLGAIPMREVINRVNLEPNIVGEVFWGVGDTPPRKGAYLPVAIRQTLFKAKVSYDTPLIVHDNAFESLRASLIHMAIEY